MKLSLSQAAKEAKVAKSTLSRAIERGRLSAQKDSLGRFQIDPAELFRVFAPVALDTDATQQEGRGAADLKQSTTALEQELNHLKTMLAMMQDREADLKVERDSWKEQAQRLSLPRPVENAGLFARLFRRSA